MNTNDLNMALYEKMAAEQDKYRDWLKSQPSEEILNHTYEYTIREDIVMAMEELELTDAQAKALLESPSPLADVYRYFEKLETGYMDVIRDSMKILKCLLMIATAPVILVLTLFVWLCTGLIYISGLVLGLLSMVIALLGVAVLITYSPQNGVILLVMAFLISPMGLPLAAIWLLGKVQSLKFAIQDWVYG